MKYFNLFKNFLLFKKKIYTKVKKVIKRFWRNKIGLKSKLKSTKNKSLNKNGSNKKSDKRIVLEINVDNEKENFIASKNVKFFILF